MPESLRDKTPDIRPLRQYRTEIISDEIGFIFSSGSIACAAKTGNPHHIWLSFDNEQCKGLDETFVRNPGRFSNTNGSHRLTRLAAERLVEVLQAAMKFQDQDEKEAAVATQPA